MCFCLKFKEFKTVLKSFENKLEEKKRKRSCLPGILARRPGFLSPLCKPLICEAQLGSVRSPASAPAQHPVQNQATCASSSLSSRWHPGPAAQCLPLPPSVVSATDTERTREGNRVPPNPESTGIFLPNMALTMQDSITEFKKINYILFMIFCWCGNIFIEERGRKNKTPSLI